MDHRVRRRREAGRSGGVFAGQELLEHGPRAQVRERARLAEEIHDEVLQSLIAAALQIELLSTRLEDGELLRLALCARDATSAAIDQLRAVLLDLHPAAAAPAGLIETLREHLRRYDDLGGPAVSLETSLTGGVSGGESALLARAAREGVANAYKHARARAVTVSVSESATCLELVVRDDGCGFDVADALERPGHLGLASIAAGAREIGGEWGVESSPGGGTTLRVRIPRRAA